MGKEIKKDSIGYRLARIRFELGLNQKEFAFKLGVTQSAISKYQRNERLPDYGLLEKLVNLFNINTEYVFGKSENMFNEKFEVKKWMLQKEMLTKIH